MSALRSSASAQRSRIKHRTTAILPAAVSSSIVALKGVPHTQRVTPLAWPPSRIRRSQGLQGITIASSSPAQDNSSRQEATQSPGFREAGATCQVGAAEALTPSLRSGAMARIGCPGGLVS